MAHREFPVKGIQSYHDTVSALCSTEWCRMKDGGANKSSSRGQGKHRRLTSGRRGLQTQEKKQAAMVSGIACKPHFIAKFKFKFITTNFIWAFKVWLQPGASSPTLQGSQDLPPITSQTFPPYFSNHTDLFARRSHRSSGSLPLGHRTCCSLCPQCFPPNILMGCSFISFKILPWRPLLGEDFSVLPI